MFDVQFMKIYQENSQRILNALERMKNTVQLSASDNEILMKMIDEKCKNQAIVDEHRAILESDHRDFYILLIRKLYCMIIACENLSSGMVTASNNDQTLRSIILKLLSDKSYEVLKKTKIGVFIGKVTQLAKDNVAFISFADTIGSIIQVIVTMKDERDRLLGIASVADFATMACLQPQQPKDTDTMDLRGVVCKFARWMVRARATRLPSCKYNEKNSNVEFTMIKRYILNLLAESGTTLKKEHACKAADCAFAHLMKPSEGTVLYNVLNENKRIHNNNVTLDEALAATILNISLAELYGLKPFALELSPSTCLSSTIETTLDICHNDTTSTIVGNSSLIVTTATGGTSSMTECGQNNITLDHITTISEHDSKIQTLNAQIHNVENEIILLKKKSNDNKQPSNHDPTYIDAGDGKVYVKSKKLYEKNETDHCEENQELAVEDRVCQLELLVNILIEQVKNLMEQRFS
jgi:hypothetical protein